ncbi:MAG TPA: hypothetical protein PKA20_12615 [Burkholderiaceae bacterium]|nr:hypothetical protein [Burkholderiaceae bacterium]
MSNLSPKQQVKVIGSNGQISLGKQFAGRQVIVEEREPGVWLIQAATVIPDRELWVHQADVQQSLQRALKSATSTAPSESDLDLLTKELVNGPTKKRA